MIIKEKERRRMPLPKCVKCGKKGRGIITRWGIYYCRHCFREEAKRMGFRKFH